ncbi:FAD-dependent protein [Desulfosporosinus sp. OT]|uniref:NAD(P)/FAD-dependent oxidoreductase n=1 Tax=Desulfosporosinus sp. OT TaxID=913865 RepID=UPI000223ADBA|nr:FAD-binding protein [Desulfosporosinus sp. OT]EGW38991.1 pyridine nucleotide-disulfide oxidoreductase family protein [Desulfosporosinus sp. OT]
MKHEVDVLIIGAGPAGIFTALELSEHNKDLKILIVDKGRTIDKRKCPARATGICAGCNPCAITRGWSGAGAFSDGKLSLSPAVGGRLMEYMQEKQAQELIDYADSKYLQFGAQEKVYGLDTPKVEEIQYEASRHNIQLIHCPVRHLGTELAFDVLKGMYEYLLNKTNTTFWELADVQDILATPEGVKGATIQRRDESDLDEVAARFVVVAPGRGGANWLAEQTIRLGVPIVNNEVDIGVRVEVPNSIMDHLTRELYEPKLVYYSDTYDLKTRSFCVNPGGVVSEEHYDGGIGVVNGHSYADPAKKTKNTNFALLVSTSFTEPFNQPIEYGRYVARLANMLTGGGVMVQRLGDLLQGRRTNETRLKKSTTTPTLLSAVPGDLSYVLPERYLTSLIETLKAFDKIAPGMYSKNTLLYGVEVKFYSSKVIVKTNFETAIPRLYAIGDGAGITRGLMQASATGIVVGRDIVNKV